MNLQLLLDRLKNSRTGINYKRKQRRRATAGQLMNRNLGIEHFEPRIMLASDLTNMQIDEVLDSTSPQVVTDGFFTFFDGVVDTLQDTFDQVKSLPIIGDQIQKGVEPFFQTLDRVGSDLETLIGQAHSNSNESLVGLYEAGLFGIFGPDGLNILKDGSDPGNSIEVADIVRSSGADESDGMTQFPTSWVQWDIHLGQNTSVTVPFEFGIDFGEIDSTLFSNLGFNIDAGEGIQFDLFWDLRLAFGVTGGNQDNGVSPGFFLNSGAVDQFGDDVEELRAGVEVYSAGDPGLSANLALGLVNGQAVDGTISRTTISGGSEVVPLTNVLDTLTYQTDFVLSVADDSGSTDFNIVLPPVAEDFADFVIRLNLELVDQLRPAYPLGFPPVIVTPDGSGINGLFDPDGQGGPSLIFTATRPEIESMTIEFNAIPAGVPSSTLGFGEKQYEDGRSQTLGFTGEEAMVGNELLALTEAPTEGGLAEDVDFTLMVDTVEVPIILRTTATEELESLEELRDLLEEVLTDALSQAGLDPALPEDPPVVEVLIEGEFFKLVANAGHTLAVESDGIDTTSLSLVFMIDVTHPDDDFDADMIDADDQSTFNRVTMQDLQGSSEIVQMEMKTITDLLPPKLAAEAELRFHVDANAEALSNFAAQGLGVAGSSLGLPELEFDLKIDASTEVTYTPGEGFEAENEIGPIQFDNIAVDIGSLLRNILQPFTDIIDQTIGPILSVIGPATGEAAGFLNAPIPVLEQISGLLGISPPSLLDLSGNKEEFNKFLAAVQGIAGFSDEISQTLDLLVNDDRPITIGCWQYEAGEGGASGTLVNCEFAAAIESINLDDFLNLPEFDWDPGGFMVDFLSPGSITNMILGEPFDLVSYQLPTATLEVGANFGFDWRLFGFDINATASLNLGGDTGIGFVYDSTGLESIIGSARAGEIPDYGDLLDGFYIQTDPDNPELSLTVNAGGGGSASFANVSVGGSMSLVGDVTLDIIDPNNTGPAEENGQIRLDEIYELTDNFNRPDKLINLFDAGVSFSGSFGIGGSIDFGLFDVSLNAGDFGVPTSVSANLQLSDIIGSFTEVTLDPTPVLAEPVFQNGRRLLRINVGPHANARLHGDLTDGNDNVVVSGTNGALSVQVNGVTQQPFIGIYDGIVAAGGLGDNTLNFAGVSGLPVILFGGEGVDTLTGGNSNDTILGGGGNDTIVGGLGNDWLRGEDGDDDISGGAGADVIFGGKGADIIDGGQDNDTVDGGSGNDDISGGAGNDVLRGFAGNDTIAGNDGADLIEGGFGIDNLSGGIGNDTIRGGRGNDMLSGGADNDQLFGGTGNDNLEGNDGDDALNGEQGNDDLDGGAGNDELHGGGGRDMLFGGADNDVLFGEESNDKLRGDAGADVLYGNIGDDLLIADVDDIWIQGHEGYDVFRIDQRGAADPITATLTNNTINSVLNLATYVSVERIEVFLNDAGGDIFTINRTDLPLEVMGGSLNDQIIVRNLSPIDSSVVLPGMFAGTVIDGGGGDDTITVSAANEALLVMGGDGGADNFVLDLILDFNGLVGSLVDNGFTGLGIAGPVTYEDDVEQITVNLSAGVDLLDIDYATSDITTIVNARNGDDQITIQSIIGLTSINGQMDNDTVIVPITDDPNTLDETSYANLRLNVETLRVVHAGPNPTDPQVDWRVGDDAVLVGAVPLINILGARKIVIDAGNNAADTISVVNNSSTRQSIVVENNTVDVEVGARVMEFTAQNQGSFFNRSGTASSVVVSGDGLNVYALDAVEGVIEAYIRNPVSGELVLHSELNTGLLASELMGATALDISSDGSSVVVATPRTDEFFLFERDLMNDGGLSVNNNIINSAFQLTGTDVLKISGHNDRLYLAGDSTATATGGFTTLGDLFNNSFGNEAENVGAESGFRVKDIEIDTVETLVFGSVTDPSGTASEFIGSEDLAADGDYVGKYLRFTNNQHESVGFRRMITGYDGATRTLQFADPFLPFEEPIDGSTFVIEERVVEYIFVSKHASDPMDSDKIQVYARVPGMAPGTSYEPVGSEIVLSRSAGALSLSPDGTSLYVANPEEDSITKLDWNRSTPMLDDSNLTMVTDGVGDTDGLEGIVSIAASDSFVFAVGAAGNSVAAFARAVNGDLTFSQVIRDKGERAGGLANPNRVTVTTDGFIYVSSTGEGVGAQRNPGGVAWLPIDSVATPDVLSFDFPDLGDFIDTPGQAFSTVVSPDGLHTYTVQRDTDTIQVYERDTPTGDLIFVEEIALSDVVSIAISPLGEHLYAVGTGSNNVSRFLRNPISGELTSEVTLPVSPAVVGNSTEVRISPNGEQVYITDGSFSGQLAVFDRDSVSGVLTYSLSFGGITDPMFPADFTIQGIDVSPNSEFLIVSYDFFQEFEFETAQVVVWQRVPDGGGGPPTYNQIDTHVFDSAGDVAISPDGDHVFVAMPREDAFTVFTRNDDTGVLTELQTVRNGADGVRGLGGVSALEVSEKFVYAAGTGEDSVLAFRRGDDGTIVLEQRLLDQAAGVLGLQNGNSLSLSPDREYLYVGSTGQDSFSGGVAWLALDEDAAPPADYLVEHFDVKSLGVVTAGGIDLVRLRDANALIAGMTMQLPVTINTQGGPDRVDIRTQAANQLATIQLGSGGDTVDLRSNGDGSSVVISGGDGEDRVNVWSTGTNNTTEISTEAGNDTIRVAGREINSDVMIFGGDPAVLLPENDPGDTLLFDPSNPNPGTPNTDPLPPLMAGNGMVRIDEPGTFKAIYESIETPRIINPPIPTAISPMAIDEGAEFDALNPLSVSAVIPQLGDATFTWDLNGDGTFGDIPSMVAATGVNVEFEITWEQLVALGIDDDGTYIVAARITDSFGEFAETTATLTINNVAPTVSIGPDGAVEVGELFELDLTSSDPGADTIASWTINWGDGQTEMFLGDPEMLTHAYDTPGMYTIHVDQITDEDGTYPNPAPADVTVTVTEVLPIISTINGLSAVAEGSPYTLNLSSLQGGVSPIGLEWTVNWGDGVVEITTTNPASLVHVYDGPATFVIVATTTDIDGLVTVIPEEITVAVSGVDPVLTLSTTDPTTFDEGTQFTLNLASVDPGDDTISSWTVNWGDGTLETIVGNPSSLTHVYDDGPASYTISATAADEDGTYASNTLGVMVNNVAPALMISGPTTIDEGEVYTLSLGSSDVGDDAISTWTINWGDGSQDTVVSSSILEVTHTFSTGPNTHTITATATDEDGTFAATAINVTVNDIPLAPIATGQESVFEGSLYTLSLSNAGPASDVISGWLIDWGDDTAVQFVPGNPETVVHRYADGDSGLLEPNFLHTSASAVPTVDNDTVQSTIVVSSVTGSLADVDVTLDITHSVLADLEIFLVGPNGTRIALVEAAAASGVDFTDTVFDDLALGAFENGSAPYTGSFRPADPLARLASIDPNGTWTLEVTDTGGANTGVIDSWSLKINEGVLLPGTVHSIVATSLDAMGAPHAAAPHSVGVLNDAPETELSGPEIVTLGTVFELTVGDVTDPGVDTVSEYRVLWGDGTPSEVVSGPGVFTHTYANRGQFGISITLADEDGEHGAAGVLQVDVGLSADFDSDGDVDGADFLAWQRGFGKTAPNAIPNDGDADIDLDVDDADLDIWQRQFGGPGVPASPASITTNFFALTPEESIAQPLLVTSVTIDETNDLDIAEGIHNSVISSSASLSVPEAVRPLEFEAQPLQIHFDLIAVALTQALLQGSAADVSEAFVLKEADLHPTVREAGLLEFVDTVPSTGNLRSTSRLPATRADTGDESEGDLFSHSFLDDAFEDIFK